jgi:hypothetical protein
MLGACRSVYVRRQLAEYRIHARRMSATMADLIRERDDLYARQWFFPFSFFVFCLL